MKPRGLWAAGVVLLVVGVVGVMAIGTGYAEDENTSRAKCSEATLHGTYLFADDGFVIRDNEKVPFASSGYEVYDGNGHVKGVFSGNFNGEITRNGKFSGTYTVKANCTGTTTYTIDGVDLQSDLFIAPDGSRFTFVQIKPKSNVTSGFELRGTAERVGD